MKFLRNYVANAQEVADFALKNEGAKFGFSRTLRASIDRVKALKLPLPPNRPKHYKGCGVA